MNYKRIYDSIIDKARKEMRFKGEETYYEKHHIIPKSLGGSNKKDNLILLTSREHFICHALLVKIYSDGESHIKMCRAFNMMAVSNNKHNRYVNSRIYQYNKEKLYGNNGILTGENASGFGLKHTEENKEKFREQKLGIKNPMYGEKPWNYGLTQNNDNRIALYVGKMKNTKKEKPQNVSEATREKLRNKAISNGLGKGEKTDEHRKKLSEANMGKIPGNAKKIYVKGIIYKTRYEASSILGINPSTLYSWAKNDKIIDIYFIN